VTPNDSFIQALFLDNLGVAATPADLAFFENTLNTCPNGQQVVAFCIESSPAARQRLATQWFVQFLGVMPTADQVAPIADQLATQAIEVVLANFLASAAYFQKAGGTDLCLRDSVYTKDLLRRSPSPAEFQAQVALLALVGRPEFVFQLLTSPEYRTLTVTGLYTNLLHRTPSPAEVNSWVFSGLSTNQILFQIESSAEFLPGGRLTGLLK